MRIPILRFAITVTCLVLCSAPYQVQADSYVLTSGTYTFISVPGATASTNVFGINDQGQIVGAYGDATGGHGFLYSGGSFTPINVPGNTEGDAHGINAQSQIVGSYTDATGTHGFQDSAGSFTPINVPGTNSTEPSGINAQGDIVGIYNANPVPGGFIGQGFLYSGGSFTPIDVPGASITEAFGINAQGQIVGIYRDATGPQGTHAFLYSGGSFTPIDVPGATETTALGINTGGQIVGYAAIPHPPTTVPEPSSLLLHGIALVGLAAWRWKKSA